MANEEVRSKRAKKLTAYEAGQELIRASDCLDSVAAELKDWPELQTVVINAQYKIGRAFNKHKSHVFGLKDGT